MQGRPKRMVGWRYAALIGGLTGAIILTLYPIAIQPYMDPTPWKELQKANRKGIDQEAIQPGGMKVWSDPFDRKK